MSKARRIKRQQERIVAKHMSVLGELLGRFYTFLDRKPKPSDESVREEFIKSEKSWKTYCTNHHLNQSASLLFNQEVAQSWKKRYAKESIQKQTLEQ